MKTILSDLHLIIYIALALCLCACENEIPFNPVQREPQLIMNALLDAGAKKNLVYLHLGEGHNIGRVNNATVALYVNGQLRETPEPLSAEEIIANRPNSSDNGMQEPASPDINYKVFALTTVLSAGDNIRLEATAENGKYRVSAEVAVPHPVDEIQVDTLPAHVRMYNQLYPCRQYKIGMKDRPNETNYYRLEINHDFSFRCQYINESYPDTIITMRHIRFINREDVILTDGHPTTSDDEDNEPFPTIKNTYNIFTDSRFSNAAATLKVYTGLYEKVLPDAKFKQIYRRGTSTVRIISITEAEYRYLRALNYIISDEYDETIMEPVGVPGNVKGGLGFVGAQISRDYSIQYPETALNYSHTADSDD